MNVDEILSKAADLLEPEGAWGGHKCSGRYCASTAIAKVTDGADLPWPRNQEVVAFFAEQIGGEDRYDVFRWNDAPEHTQAEVVAKLREAAELAREHQS